MLLDNLRILNLLKETHGPVNYFTNLWSAEIVQLTDGIFISKIQVYQSICSKEDLKSISVFERVLLQFVVPLVWDINGL
jgi:hypothetical protein